MTIVDGWYQEIATSHFVLLAMTVVFILWLSILLLLKTIYY